MAKDVCYQKPVRGVGCFTAPPKVVHDVLQPGEEHGLTFLLRRLQGRETDVSDQHWESQDKPRPLDDVVMCQRAAALKFN